MNTSKINWKTILLWVVGILVVWLLLNSLYVNFELHQQVSNSKPVSVGSTKSTPNDLVAGVDDTSGYPSTDMDDVDSYGPFFIPDGDDLEIGFNVTIPNPPPPPPPPLPKYLPQYPYIPPSPPKPVSCFSVGSGLQWCNQPIRANI